MKQGTIALLILLAPITSLAQTTKTFDKFKNITHFGTGQTLAGKVTYGGGKDASTLIQSMGVVIGFSCEGQVDGCKPEEIELLFIAHTSDWMMKGNNEVNLLIDGTPASAGKADWDGQVLEAEDLREYNDTHISPALLARLAEAKTAEVQIGQFEFSLTDANLVSIRDIAVHTGWLPKDLKKTLVENAEMSKASPAAAAQLAQDGHINTSDEMAQLIQKGQASKTGVITSPAGAEVYVDGNKAGVTPLVFVLLKRDHPRVLTIKLPGYKTVEKTLVPDGKNIPIGITLEKDQ